MVRLGYLLIQHLAACDAPITHITGCERSLVDRGVEMAVACVETGLKVAQLKSQSVPGPRLSICSREGPMSTFKMCHQL